MVWPNLVLRRVSTAARVQDRRDRAVRAAICALQLDWRGAGHFGTQAACAGFAPLEARGASGRINGTRCVRSGGVLVLVFRPGAVGSNPDVSNP
jgi:hypothetical protein